MIHEEEPRAPAACAKPHLALGFHPKCYWGELGLQKASWLLTSTYHVLINFTISYC